MSATATLSRDTHSYVDSAGKRVSLSVSSVMSLANIVEPYPDDPRVRGFVEHAGELGTSVHAWSEWLDDNEQGPVDEFILETLRDTEPLPYVTAYQRFRAEHEPEWEHIEQSFTDPDLDCAGTPDRIGTIKKGKSRIPVIVDIKTAKQVAKYWPIQLSAYQYLSRRLDSMLYVVHLAADGSFKLRPYESDVETFLAAVRVAKWRLRNGAKVR